MVGLGVRYFFYGSLFSNCEYTEKELQIPQELSAGEVIFTKDIRQAIGKSGDYGCLKYLGSIHRELVPPDTINGEMLNMMFEHEGRTVEAIPARMKTFHVTGILEVTKHGIGTIDSGPGPIYFLVLRDEAGELYNIATVELYENGGKYGDEDIAEIHSGSKVYPFNIDTFDAYDPNTSKTHFQFRLNGNKVNPR